MCSFQEEIKDSSLQSALLNEIEPSETQLIVKKRIKNQMKKHTILTRSTETDPNYDLDEDDVIFDSNHINFSNSIQNPQIKQLIQLDHSQSNSFLSAKYEFSPELPQQQQEPYQNSQKKTEYHKQKSLYSSWKHEDEGDAQLQQGNVFEEAKKNWKLTKSDFLNDYFHENNSEMFDKNFEHRIYSYMNDIGLDSLGKIIIRSKKDEYHEKIKQKAWKLKQKLKSEKNSNSLVSSQQKEYQLQNLQKTEVNDQQQQQLEQQQIEAQEQFSKINQLQQQLHFEHQEQQQQQNSLQLSINSSSSLLSRRQNKKKLQLNEIKFI